MRRRGIVAHMRLGSVFLIAPRKQRSLRSSYCALPFESRRKALADFLRIATGLGNSDPDPGEVLRPWLDTASDRFAEVGVGHFGFVDEERRELAGLLGFAREERSGRNVDHSRNDRRRGGPHHPECDSYRDY